ncbi:MAG: hypothetical protein ACT4PT_09030 [Methanobacteriota archaeon]
MGVAVFIVAATASHGDVGVDAGASSDAGASLSTSILLPGSGSFDGILDPGNGDSRDVFRFQGSWSDLVSVSLSQSGAGGGHVKLKGPSGETLGEAGSLIGDVPLSDNGTYEIDVEQTNQGVTNYVLGLVQGPDPEPCRPTCVS